MLLNGNPSGINDLNTYDAACVAWAFLDEYARATPESMNPAGPLKLRHDLLGTTPTEIEDLNEIRQTMGMDPIAAASIGQPPTPVEGTAEDLAEIRAMLSGDSPAS